MDLKRSYEVSIWSLQDEFITVLKPLDVENIGQLENKDLELKTDDGLNQYSCSIPMYIYDGANRIENPIWYNTLNGNIVSNLRKIKIILNKGEESEEVYEFLIIKVEERHDKDQLYCDITCEDLAFHELGKQGYKISLSTDVFLEEYSTWADTDGDIDNEPHSTLQYWLSKFLAPVPENPISTEWYYDIQMNWDAYADGPNRDTSKVYEEEYTSSWALQDEKLVPVAVEEYKEKERLVDLQESNIFNLTQDLAQTFEVFARYQYLYDDNYHICGRRIIFYNNYLREEEGIIDISYPYEASQITRSIDAVDVTTKMYVRPVTEESSESGLLSITEVDANRTKEDYLLNFDYLYSIGAITEEQYAEIPKYEAYMRAYNIELDNLKSYMDVLETDLTELEASKTIVVNSIKLDQERIQEAQDLLNSLDAKDNNIDGAITIDEYRPASAVLLAQENSNKYYINITEPGVKRETLHIYTKYEYVGSSTGLSGEISGTFVDDEFGNLIQVRNLVKPNNMVSSLVYMTYTYVPKLQYEQVEKIWTIRLSNDQKKLDALETEIAEKQNALNSVKEDYDSTLTAKKERIESFNRMMGPALRESYWQPDDYKATGDKFNDTYSVVFNSSTPIAGESGYTKFIWNTELFDDEQKSYYEISAVENLIYYPCIDLSGNITIDGEPVSKLNYVLENYDKISFMFYDYIAGESDPYQIKYFRHFTLGSEAQLAFARISLGGEPEQIIIKPIMILTGAETISLYTIRNMINSKDNSNDGPLIGIYTIDFDATTGEIEESIDENAFVATWLNLVSSQTVNSTTYDLTNATEFDVWAEARFASEDNNIEIIATAESDIWNEVILVYPRIQIDSMLLKNDESLSVHCGDTLLENYEDYYVLTRRVELTPGDEEAEPPILPTYKGMYFLTIKPQAFSSNNISFYYTLSNAQTAIYLDAKQVIKENAYPKVTYTITPTLIHRDLHYTLYKLLNRIVNINDVDLKFDNVQGYISSLSLDLDNPFNDSIEIKNYRNKFEDLFSSIVAQTESMKKNSFTIGLAAASFTPSGALSPAVIQQSINNADLNYAFNQGNLTISEDEGIWATSDDGVVAMRGGGIFTATQKNDDGEWMWNTGILPSGINASLITTGQLDTNLIRIYAGDKLKFQLNGDGLYAYKSIFDEPDILDLMANGRIDPNYETSIINKIESNVGLDLKQYVVHNENGLFLVAEAGAIIKVRPEDLEDTEQSENSGEEQSGEESGGENESEEPGNENESESEGESQEGESNEGESEEETNIMVLTELQSEVTRVEISWNGLILRDWSNNPVFYADADTGDLNLTGHLYATDITIMNDVILGEEGNGKLILRGRNLEIDTENLISKWVPSEDDPNVGEQIVRVKGEITATSLKIGEDTNSYDNWDDIINSSTFVANNSPILDTMSFRPEEGLIIRPASNTNQAYYTQITSEGYYINYIKDESTAPITVAKFTGTETNVLNLRVGDIVVVQTSSNGWAWIDA